MAFNYQWCISAQHDEVDEQYQNLQHFVRREFFNMQFRVVQVLHHPYDDEEKLTQTQLLESFHYSDLIVIEKLFDHGLQYLEKTLPEPLVPGHVIRKIFPQVLSFATRMIESNHSKKGTRDFKYVLPLVVEINVVTPSKDFGDGIPRIITRDVKRQLVSEAEFQKALETTWSEKVNLERVAEPEIDVEFGAKGSRKIFNTQLPRSSSMIISPFLILVGFNCVVLLALFVTSFFVFQ